MKKAQEEIIAKVIGVVLAGAMPLFFMVGISMLYREDAKQYQEEVSRCVTEFNEGTCLECGGRYSLSSTVFERYPSIKSRNRGRGTTYYLYECEDCGHVLRSPANRPLG